MSQAYTGVRATSDVPKDQTEKVPVVAVVLGQLDRKNGIRFLAHTLRAAKNAGFISLEKSVQFARGEANDIIIHTAVKKSDTKKPKADKPEEKKVEQDPKP